MNYFAGNLKFLRKKSAKIQGDIGFLVNKGQSTIGNWENGNSEPNIEELLIISNFFDISVDILLKVNLALTNYQPAPARAAETALTIGTGAASPATYPYNEQESMVEESENQTTLAELLREIRLLRVDFRQAKIALKKPPRRSTAKPASRKPGSAAGTKRKNG